MEGESDERAVEYLLRKEIEKLKEYDIITRRLGGKSRFKKEIGKSTRDQFLTDKAVKAVFALIDLFPKDNDPKKLKRELMNSVPGEYRKKFYPHVAVYEIETWLIADEKALKKMLETNKIPRNLTGNPEKLNSKNNPKKRLRKAKPGYSPFTNGIPAFKKVNPDVVAAKCEHFRMFREDIRSFIKP